ncbi:MAG: 30S ribosomal protein S1 [Deltaproteobacteria bacterium]|nr:MAG: 30S ribosomal protein S1 [Deltaproteobacteria bacterium]
MENEMDNFEALLLQEERKSPVKLTVGKQITAEIVGVEGEYIFLDVGGKSEGIINASEFTDDEGGLTVKTGDKIEVYYLGAEAAELRFTTRLGSGSSLSHLEEAWQGAIPVEGLVKAEIKGGFEITLGGKTRAFCPYSQMDLRRIENPEEYLEKRLNFLITRFEENGRNIVVSARAILEMEREKMREKLKKSLAEGQTVTGEITAIKDFGAFIDIGGIEGLIPVSEIGWGRIEDIGEYLSVGQQASAVVKSLDWEQDRFSFSLKETMENPWQKAEQDFVPGSTHTGKIVRLAQFGAFVNLAPGIDGLVHISKLGGGRRIFHPKEVVEEGQSYDVKIESFDAENQKISLAPADYTSKEGDLNEERANFDHYRAKKQQNLGSLGALLKAKMAEKGASSKR